jgi:virginiamycin B lyase
VKSTHTADEFVALITRMQTYYPDGSAVSRDGRGRGQLNMPDRVAAAERSENWGSISKKDLAAYLATINLSGGRTTWPFELKTLPRPTGKATRVIITQYDMPRPDTVAHDLARDVQIDRDDNVWFPRRIANAAVVMTKFDPKTETISTIAGTGGQFMAIGPDGKIWAGLTRIDPTAMKVEASYTWMDSPNIPPGPHGLYIDLSVIDSKGNPYAPDFRGSGIIGIDAVTRAVKYWPVPTPNSSPRRSRMDAQDRLWFAEYTGDKIGMFDTRT